MADPEEFAPRRGVGAQAILLVGAMAVAQASMAVIYVLGAKSVTPAQFGHIASVIALGTAAVGFFDFGSSALWVRELARGTLSRETFRSRASSKLLVGASAAAVWSVVAACTAPLSGLWAAGPMALSLLTSQTVQVVLRARARAEIAALSIVADRLLALGGAGIMVLLGVSVGSWMWLLFTISPLFGAFVGFVLTPTEDRMRVRLHWANPWSGSHFYGLSSLAVSSQSLDVPLLNAVGGPTAAGLYGAVNRWAQPLSLLANSFATVSIPYVSRAKTFREGWAHARKASWLIILALLGACILFLLAPFIVPLLLGDQYAAAVPVLQVLALAAIPSIVNQPLATFTQSMGFDRVVSVVVPLGIALFLLLAATMSSVSGAFGVALAQLIAQSTMCLALAVCLFLAARRAARKGLVRT